MVMSLQLSFSDELFRNGDASQNAKIATMSSRISPNVDQVEQQRRYYLILSVTDPFYLNLFTEFKIISTVIDL